MIRGNQHRRLQVIPKGPSLLKEKLMRLIFTKLASRHLTILLVVAFLATGFMASTAGAQVLYGSLVGNVTDQNGAVVAGASVTITNKGTGQMREAVTNADGEYTIIN